MTQPGDPTGDASTRFHPIPPPSPEVPYPVGYVIGGPVGGIELPWVVSLLRLMQEQGPDVTPHARLVHVALKESGPYLDDARNFVVQSALQQPDMDVMVFVDADIDFTPADVDTLVSSVHPSHAPIVGGAYKNYSPSQDEFVVAYRLEGQQISPVDPREVTEFHALTPDELDDPDYQRIRDVDAGLPPGYPHDLVAVDGIGTGFLAIHRNVLTHMFARYQAPTPWFAEPNMPDGQGGWIHLGEDLGFCLRARALGYPVYLNPAVRVGHTKKLRHAWDTRIVRTPPDTQEN